MKNEKPKCANKWVLSKILKSVVIKIQGKVMKNPVNKLAVLNNRLEKLIELNQRYGYTSVLTSEKKTKQYYSLLLRIREEKHAIYIERRKNEVYSGHLETAKNNIITTLTRDYLYNLTAPKV